MRDNAGHDLPSFATYLNKVFRFRDALPTLQDARQDPEIPPQAVFLASFCGFVGDTGPAAAGKTLSSVGFALSPGESA